MKKILLSLVAISTLTFGASAQLYDQSVPVVTNGIISAYMSDNDTIVQCADDFTVPAGSNWSVSSVAVQGFRNFSGANMTEMTVEIWSDATGPSAIIYSEDITLAGAGVPAPQNDTLIVLNLATAQTLATGTYWLSVYGNSESTSRWNWASRDPAPFGSVAVLLDADDYFGTTVTDWVELTSIGLTDPDLCFIINGVDQNAGLVEISDEVSIYPNPAKDVLNIEVKSAQKIEKVIVVNVDGKIVLSLINPTAGIDVSELISGSYFLEVLTEFGISRTHFVKE